MEPVYIYKDHFCRAIYLRKQPLSPEEEYCPICEAEELLLGVFDHEEALIEELHRLLRSYDLIALMSDLDILRKYSVCEINRKYLPR